MTAFEELAALLEGRVSKADLLKALYVLRYPRHLNAVIPAARQFVDWCKRFPALQQLPELPDYARRLEVIRCIAELETEESFSGKELAWEGKQKHKNEWTPLRPLTGDSVIGELLLIRGGEGVDNSDFEKVCVWLVWQAQRFQLSQLTESDYEAYLRADASRCQGSNTHERLKTRDRANRLYQAYLSLQQLTDASHADVLHQLACLTNELSEESSVRLLLLLRLGQLQESTERRRLVDCAADNFGLEGETLQQGIRSCARLESLFALFLRTIWDDALSRRTGNKQKRSSVGRAAKARPDVHYSEFLIECITRLNEDDWQDGTLIDIYERIHDPEEADPDYDDPGDDGLLEPSVSLFLAEKADLIQGYYAGKGVQSVIEYQNAQLRWDRTTLSQEAVAGVLALLRQNMSGKYEPWAQLAIGLSLITGRSLEETAAVIITDDPIAPSEAAPLVINRQACSLAVKTGKPDLKSRNASTPMVHPEQAPPFCRARVDQLVLSLPSDWHDLIASLNKAREKENKKVVDTAKRLLATLPKHLQVTQKSLRSTFIQRLSEQTKGDLGAQKAITDGHEANSQNVIHYASYEAVRLQETWKEAVETLVGALPMEAQIIQPQGYVGSQHAFRLDEVAAYLASLKVQSQQAMDVGDWAAAFNGLTHYLARWLQLGLVLRSTRHPLPSIWLSNDWMVVTDKHRPDGSTDRLLPITPALRQQVMAYLAASRALMASAPALQPLQQDASGVFLQLFYIEPDGQVTPYRPHLHADSNGAKLPPNWGRKVVRSLSSKYPGRFRDAELGHWVRGRHAWDITSTLDAQDFQQHWLKAQQFLEAKLGMTVIMLGRHAEPIAPYRTPLPSKPRQSEALKRANAEVTIEQLESLIRQHADDHLAYLEDPKNKEKSDYSNAALKVAHRLLKSQERQPVEQQRQIAEAVCGYLRQRFGAPVFALPPRRLFARQHLLDASALQTLAYCQQALLPAFENELTQLPARAEPLSRDARLIEAGRLVMLAIWRLGLTRWSLIDAWLESLYRGDPALALGECRYMHIQVDALHTSERMGRTVYLDAFTQAYLVMEHSCLQRVLPGLRQEKNGKRFSPQRRRAKADEALKAYLCSLGLAVLPRPLTALTQAATQWLMITSAPVIAAYASGALYTEDLGDTQLRRLAGYAPVRSGSVRPGLSQSNEEELSGDDLPPSDVLGAVPLLHLLTTGMSQDKAACMARLAAFQPQARVDALLKAFALWLLTQSLAQGATFTGRESGNWVGRVQVVAFALLGLTEQQAKWDSVDEDVLLNLQEVSRHEFPQRLQHGAWSQFHRFLSDASADHAGIRVGDIGTKPERAVSACLFSQSELDRLLQEVSSARSGIGNASLRLVAKHHLELMMTYGLRRAESAFLRSKDWQGNVCRVQAYDERRLKTAWANRLLPVEFATADMQRWMREAKEAKRERLIDTDGAPSVNPDNFYHALNGLIKRVTGDANMGSHHLRHTLATRLLFTLLNAPAGLEQLGDDFAWLKDLIVPNERMAVLLGSEGNAGQGLRMISALVGHSHPTTTLHHYIHGMGICLYGALHKLDQLDMSRSFENRIAQSTVQRWVQKTKAHLPAGLDEVASRHWVNQQIRNLIEKRFHHAGIHRDDTRMPDPDKYVIPEAMEGKSLFQFDLLEKIDRSLRDGSSLVSKPLVETSRQGLALLAEVPSGGRWRDSKRHSLIEMQQGVFLPKPIAAGEATLAAAALCLWLSQLWHADKAGFVWLIQKWINASEGDRGRMRLDGEADIQKAKNLSATRAIRLEIDDQDLSQAENRPTGAYPKLRIRCLGATGKKLTRDTGAVRWVMSHIAARWLVRDAPPF